MILIKIYRACGTIK